MKDVEEFQHNAIALNGLSMIKKSGEFSLSKVRMLGYVRSGSGGSLIRI